MFIVTKRQSIKTLEKQLLLFSNNNNDPPPSQPDVCFYACLDSDSY